MKKICLALLALFASTMCACSEVDEPMPSDIQGATATITVDIPSEIFLYYELSGVHNNALCTDVVEDQIFDTSTYSLEQTFAKVPSDAPLQLRFRRTNRPLPADVKLSISVTEKAVVHKATGDIVVGSRYSVIEPLSGPFTVRNFAVRFKSDGSASLIMP